MNAIIIAVATAIHLLPHPYNVSTLGALALYAGAFGRRPGTALTPLIPLSLGLLITGLYEPLILGAVAAGFLLATIPGRVFLSGQRTLGFYGAAVATGAVLFYLVSNLSVWWVYYPRSVEGFVACYLNGLPFLGQSMVADAAYCFLLFGLHVLIEKRKAVQVVA